MSAPHHAAPKALARARELVDPALAAALRTLEPSLHRVAGYHMGFLDAEGSPVAGGRGKALRPALAILSAEAAGAAADRALAAAAAVELVHDFTLLHDDVMDHDRERRHKPTAWVVFGMGPAICAGDALMLLAQQVLLADSSPHRHAAVSRLADATQDVIAGQARDLALEGRTDTSVEAYFEMTAGKTAALLACAASLGAVLTGAEAPVVQALEAFGRELGLAFQAVDDWLGAWGESSRTGKPAANDLRQRKSALPAVLALGSGHPAATELRALFEEPDDARDPEARGLRALELVTATGAEARTREIATRHRDRARRHLRGAGIADRARAELLEITAFVTQREF